MTQFAKSSKKRKTRLICLWSGPRNVSTALMYSFAERADTQIVDEPLYGHYLSRTDVQHPAAAEVIAAMNCDGQQVINDLLARCDAPVTFAKHMAHHLIELDEGFLQQTINVLLVRNPRDMLPSLSRQIPEPTLRDTGLKRQWELLKTLQRLGQSPAVLDAQQLLADPPGVLRQLCEHIGIDFDASMLQWRAGARDEDGVWAPHWYHNVHKSTGFDDYHERTEVPDHLQAVLAQCAPYYDYLRKHAICATD
ncbi:MAG: sulfotransferase family protein [Pseudomonadota bacterium]